MNQTTLSEHIRTMAQATRIDVLGFAHATEFADYALTQSRRRDPKLSLPHARTIIVAGIYIGGLTLPGWTNPWYGRTSRLYLSGFFLDVVKPLEPIAAFLRRAGYRALVCDSSGSEGSILPLKLAAIRAGLGWQGKHSLLISRQYGTFLALGGIVTDAELEHNQEQEPNRCRTCTKCQAACPLGALEQAHVLNTGRCLSYLLQTEDLPAQAQAVSENRVGDCEICQEVCPWNKKHLDHPLATRLTRSFQGQIPAWESIFYLPDLAKLTPEGYRDVFGQLNTAIPYDIFHRNAALALQRAQERSH
jgi:epoxyqueuosine reductase